MNKITSNLWKSPYRTIGIIMLEIVLTVSLSFAQSTKKDVWDEDPERVKYHWKIRLSPEDYMNALQNTGQLQALQESATLKRSMAGMEGFWTPIGPTGDFGSTEERNGRIRSIHIQPIAGGDYYIYVGACSGGLWRAQGSLGPVWEDLGTQLPNPSVGAFAVNHDNPDDILVGTGDYNRWGGAGMFRTTDAGQNWTQISLPVSPGAFFRIYYLPGNSNIILAASDAGLLRSTNGPNGPWNVVLNGMVSDLIFHPTDTNIQYCCRATTFGNDGGVYKSTDAGQTWPINITSAHVPSNQVLHSRIAICRDSPDNMVFVYEGSATGTVQGIWKSITGGNTWTNITGTVLGGGQAFHALAIAIHPNNPDVIYVGANQLWRSTNGGSTWPDITNIARHQDQTQLYFSTVTGNNVMWICNDGGIYRYTIGGNTDSWNGNGTNGLRVSQIYELDAQRDFRVIAMQDDGIAGSIDAGNSWKGFNNADGTEAEISDDLDFTFWFCDGIYSNAPLVRVTKQPFNGSGQQLGATEIYDKLFFERFSNKIYSVNSKDGPTPHLVSSPATGTLSWNEEFVLPTFYDDVTGNPFNGNTLFLRKWNPGKLIVLQKSGTGWNTIATLNTTNSIARVIPSTEWSNESWACLAGAAGTPKVLHTTNFWSTWTDISGSLTDVGIVTAIVATPFNAQELYAATDMGVFHTQNGGATWEPFQTGLPVVLCNDLRYIIDHTRNGNDKLVVATFGRGVYERTIVRPPLVYVDSRNAGFEDGTLEHPFNTFDEGLAATPDGGILALRGDVYTVPTVLNKPIKIMAYESVAELRP